MCRGLLRRLRVNQDRARKCLGRNDEVIGFGWRVGRLTYRKRCRTPNLPSLENVLGIERKLHPCRTWHVQNCARKERFPNTPFRRPGGHIQVPASLNSSLMGISSEFIKQDTQHHSVPLF